MDFALFSSLLKNLLHVQVLCTDGKAQDFQSFCDKYCYNVALQPAFTAETLSRLTGEAQEHILYGLQDELGICLIFFRREDRIVLVGPFVRADFSEAKVQPVLLRHHIPGSFAASVQLYYSAFPVVSSTHVRNTVIACINALSGANEEYGYCRLRGATADTVLPQPFHEESLDYSALHQRYDLENRFLHMIETGDVENVLIAKRAMTMAGMTQNRYINAVYHDPGIGFAMLRAMVRKAAERGGASLVEIHEITQRAVQNIAASHNSKEQNRYSDAMILELTEAVRRSRMTVGAYSPPIRKIVEHIRLNYTQKLSLSDLASLSNLSESYLSKTFKKEVGQNLSQYVEHLRCDKAAEMLQSGRTPIQEISGYVGYIDNNYFVKVFKKQYGVTPSEYRAQHQS